MSEMSNLVAENAHRWCESRMTRRNHDGRILDLTQSEGPERYGSRTLAQRGRAGHFA